MCSQTRNGRLNRKTDRLTCASAFRSSAGTGAPRRAGVRSRQPGSPRYSFRAEISGLLRSWRERLFRLLSGFLEGKPCPEYVPGGVDVGVGLVAAGQTSGLRLGDAVPRRGMPTLGAPLGGVTGVDCDHCPSGAFSLGGQDAQEDAPSRVVDGLVQADLGRRAVRLGTAALPSEGGDGPPSERHRPGRPADRRGPPRRHCPRILIGN